MWADIILPNLEQAIRTALGTPDGWQLDLDINDKDRQTVLFHFPKTFNYGYIKPSIKLEFGARGETEPSAPRPIRAYAAESFPDLFTASSLDIPTLAAERSFWEKATILHALHHGAKLLDRMSRHYYDTYMMAERGIADRAMKAPALLENVVRNKSLLFRDAKASYETAKLGSLRLVPPNTLLPSLKKDYEAMSEMFMGDFPDFDTILSGLAKLEKRLNTATSGNA